MSSQGWLGVDLDGTLAEYDGWHSWDHIGEPVPLMLERVKEWLAQGDDVRIFTARAAGPFEKCKVCGSESCTRFDVFAVIEAWCLEHLGQVLPITCCKDMSMLALWDDRCTQVESNTGRTRGPGWLPPRMGD